jgi:hypothetical protein
VPPVPDSCEEGDSACRVVVVVDEGQSLVSARCLLVVVPPHTPHKHPQTPHPQTPHRHTPSDPSPSHTLRPPPLRPPTLTHPQTPHPHTPSDLPPSHTLRPPPSDPPPSHTLTCIMTIIFLYKTISLYLMYHPTPPPNPLVMIHEILTKTYRLGILKCEPALLQHEFLVSSRARYLSPPL